MELWIGCVAGALEEREFEALLREAGLRGSHAGAHPRLLRGGCPGLPGGGRAGRGCLRRRRGGALHVGLRAGPEAGGRLSPAGEAAGAGSTGVVNPRTCWRMGATGAPRPAGPSRSVFPTDCHSSIHCGPRRRRGTAPPSRRSTTCHTQGVPRLDDARSAAHPGRVAPSGTRIECRRRQRRPPRPGRWLAGFVATMWFFGGSPSRGCSCSGAGAVSATFRFPSRRGWGSVAAGAAGRGRSGSVAVPWSAAVWRWPTSSCSSRTWPTSRCSSRWWTTARSRSYFDRETLAIYETGRAVDRARAVHLLLYRLRLPARGDGPADVVNLGDLLRFLLGTFLLYLRVSGQFHLIVGMLHLFGFRLPETHHNCTSWRRASRLLAPHQHLLEGLHDEAGVLSQLLPAAALGARRRWSSRPLIVFVVTWLLHSYQWFWLRGGFPLTPQDVLFWGGWRPRRRPPPPFHRRPGSGPRSPWCWWPSWASPPCTRRGRLQPESSWRRWCSPG
jgi:hypothetical protein